MKNRTGVRATVATRLAWIAVALGMVPMVALSQTAQEVLAEFATRIADKRGQVETLSDEVELTKSQYNEQIRSLATQIADVEIQINREEIRLAQIEQDLARARLAIAASDEQVADIQPIIFAVMDEMRAYVEEALPFQVDERLSELDTLERIMNDGSLEAQTVLTRLWNALEAEFRLASESGIYRQTVTISGEEQLAEVARLGMVLMYVRTFDDRFGYAYREGDAWAYQIAPTRDEQEQIAELFDSLRRNLREGFFDLPNPYRG